MTKISGIHQGKRACVKGYSENTFKICFLDDSMTRAKETELKLHSTHGNEHSSQNPNLPSAGINVQEKSRAPMPLFDGPIRDENPILSSSRESQWQSC